MRSSVGRLVEAIQTGYALKAFFGDDVTLIPMPRSAPLVAGALWPADVICREMVRQGLARGIEHSLRRVKEVPKSAFVAYGHERPDLAKHLATMEATPWIASGPRITVVDDVITKGVTLFAGCVLVQEVQPGADVRAFGLLRTQGLVLNINDIVDPVAGTLTQNWGEVSRNP